MLNSIPTLNDVQALDGRIFAMLTTDEISVLDFYRAQGRKFDVSVAIISEADPTDLAAARSQAEADAIMKRSNSRVSITIGPAAHAAWAARSH